MKVDVLIFSAGLGTRLAPLTDSTPKALVQLDDKPLLHYALSKLRGLDIGTVFINIHHFADQLVAYIDSVRAHYPFTIVISDERHALLETGGGIKRIAASCTHPLLAFNVDVLFDLPLADFIHAFATNTADAQLLVKDRVTARYLAFEHDRLTGWINKSSGDTKGTVTDRSLLFAFSGVQLLGLDILKKFVHYEQDSFSVIAFYLSLCTSVNICAYAQPHQWMDVGKFDEISVATTFLQQLKQHGIY